MKILNRLTLKYLSMNKSRTLITIIGIIISAAMITAVTTTISSFKTWMIESVAQKDGIYDVYFRDVPFDDAEKLITDEAVKADATVYFHNYVKIPELELTESFRYGYYGLVTLSDGFSDIVSFTLSEGRMPQNGNEILLPDNLSIYLVDPPKLGDVLTLDIGSRYDDEGYKLGETDGIRTDEEYNVIEIFDVEQTKEYTVVGFYDPDHFGFGFSDYYSGAFRLVTGEYEGSAYEVSSYIVLKNHYKYQDFINKAYFYYGVEEDLRIHSYYLSLRGAVPGSGYDVAFYSLGGILIAIIALASVSLIGSAFSISITERTRQFGLLSSIGATKKQLKRNVIFEAMLISIIAIPIGIICGLIGMAVTFHCIKDSIQIMIGSFGLAYNTDIYVRIVPSVMSIALAVICGFATVYISAYFPARRAMKMSPMDAIRSNKDIKVKPRALKTWRLTGKLLGFEGTLASKYYKRSRKKYRSTVISITISVVLFITAGLFTDYIGAMLNANYTDYQYDYWIYLFGESEERDAQEKQLLDNLSGLDEVKQITSIKNSTGVLFKVEKNAVSEEYYERYSRGAINNFYFSIIDDQAFLRFLEEEGLDKEKYTDPENLSFVFTDNVVFRDEDNKTISNVVKKEKTVIEAVISTSDGIILDLDEGGNLTIGYYDNNSIVTDGSIQMTEKKILMTEHPEYFKFELGERADAPPFGAEDNTGLHVYIPESVADQVLEDIPLNGNFANIFVDVESPEKDHTVVQNILSSTYTGAYAFENIYEEYSSIRAIFLVFRVLSYGFIVLMSMIAVVNMFNTISTNIFLRRKDFAVLASVGMTSKGTVKMMIYECLLYGTKGLIYGLPISFLISVLFRDGMSANIETEVIFSPSYSIIAVIAVFTVVAISMLYSVSKIRRANTVETVRSETA